MPVYIYIVYTTTVLDYLPVGETAQLQEIVYDGSRLCVSRALFKLGIWITPPPDPPPPPPLLDSRFPFSGTWIPDSEILIPKSWI